MNSLSVLPNNSRTRAKVRTRVEELAVLPVFLKLRGKQVLLAGGTEAAAWKAELLAASGAHVHIYAPVLDGTFQDRIATSIAYTHHVQSWSEASFEQVEIALCDAADEAEAQRFYATAKRQGVPVNVIDKPAYCSFQFGSIVNRSPTIVAISTDGAAPILGQAIRRKIETLLPPSLQQWAKLAAKLRGPMNAQLALPTQRRAFWDYLVARAFGPAPSQHAESTLRAHVTKLANTPKPIAGKVTFVGAGPGDAEHLTLKAVRALQSADIIIFDDEISSQVLELPRREAKRLMVGQGGHSLAALAKQGKHIVRLLQGDARDSSDKLNQQSKLRRANISYETVPGIHIAPPHQTKMVSHG